MRRLNYKFHTVIIAYSFILTLVFIFGMLYVQYTAASVEIISDTAYVYPLNEDEFLSIYQGNEQYLEADNMVNSSSHYQQYAEAAIQQLWPFAAFFCLFLSSASYLLWRILHKLQKKHTAEISVQFQNAEEDVTYDFQDADLNRAYEQIKKTFHGYFNDYKRLNSYLSHEQKNAIAVLRASMELADQQEYLPQLDYISSSIDDILTLSEQREEETLHAVDAVLCCASVCDMYRKRYPDIVFDFDEAHHTDILGKERWLFRAVSNIVDNAIKYGRQKPIHIHIENRNRSVIIRVQDQGIGMSDEQLADIFQYRYRISELNSNGYGIGLSLVSHVCDLCHGYAYVESQIDQGSTFYLSFPEYRVQI